MAEVLIFSIVVKFTLIYNRYSQWWLFLIIHF
jgi:hypothetical protein